MLLPILAAFLAYMGFRGREVLLGIDLGTTYSSVAIRRPGGIVVAEDASGRLGVPSVVAIHASGAWVVGEAAEAVLAQHPSRGVVDAKRVIGRRLEDPMVVSESARHGGRLMQHPTARRVAASGKGVKTAKHRAVCASGVGACWPDLAFSVALPPGLSSSQVTALAAHACVDAGSLVEVWGGASGGGGGGGEGGESLRGRLKAISRSLAPASPAAFILLTPQAASCLVVHHLLGAAEAFLGYGARKAMGAAPTEFNAAQRGATLEAMERSGLSVVRLLHEPTAAAIAYGLHKAPAVHHVLVFDFGGGTLDVSVLFSNKGAFTVIGTAGDNELGGEDVDDCVAGIMKEGAPGAPPSSAAASSCEPGALSQEAERVKKSLSGGSASVAWSCAGGSGKNVSGVVSSDDFQRVCGGLLERALKPVREALEGSNLGVAEVDEVVLVGGSSKLPAVRASLSSLFQGRELRTSVDPDLAVALGAAASGD